MTTSTATPDGPTPDGPTPDGDRPRLPWWPEPRPKAAGPEPLTRDRIVAAALELLRDEGSEALTMRRLAAHLGVSPSTIYWWVEGREQLLALLVDTVHGQVELPASRGSRPWPEQLVATAVSLYTVYRANPAVMAVMAGGVLAGPNTITLLEAILSVLVEGAGMAPEEAVAASFAIQSLVRGFVPEPSAVPGSVAAKVWTDGTGLAALPGDQFPLLVGLAPALESTDQADRFRWAVDVFVGALRSRANRGTNAGGGARRRPAR